MENATLQLHWRRAQRPGGNLQFRCLVEGLSRRLDGDRLDLNERTGTICSGLAEHVRGGNAGAMERLLAICGRGPAHAAFHVGKTGTTSAGANMATSRTYR